MPSKSEAREALTKARAHTLNASRAYKSAWRKDPGPRGYPQVDRALEALHQAEAAERVAERALAEAW